jgi:hypothetical protein
LANPRKHCLRTLEWDQSTTTLTFPGFAFLHFHKKLVLQEALEDLSDMEHVFLVLVGENEDVVELH